MNDRNLTIVDGNQDVQYVLRVDDQKNGYFTSVDKEPTAPDIRKHTFGALQTKLFKTKKRGPGRPPKPVEKRATKHFNMCMTPADFNGLSELAEDMGWSRTEVMMVALLQFRQYIEYQDSIPTSSSNMKTHDDNQSKDSAAQRVENVESTVITARRRPGRPQLPSESRAEQSFRMRLTDRENTLLTKLAKKLGMSKTSAVKTALGLMSKNLP